MKKNYCLFILLLVIGHSLVLAKPSPLLGDGSLIASPLVRSIIKHYEDSSHATSKVSFIANTSPIGINTLIRNKVQFAVSGTPPTREQERKFGPLLTFPFAIAGLTLSYNVPGIKSGQIVLNADVIASIFRGKITRWDDPALQRLNPHTKLPHLKIIPIARLQPAASTAIFTEFLQGSTCWPESLTGNGPFRFGNKNQRFTSTDPELARAVARTTGALGYVAFNNATFNNLTYARIINKRGKAVLPSIASTEAAIHDVAIPHNLHIKTLNTLNPRAYPITTPVFLVVFEKQPNKTVANNIKNFIFFADTSGQKLAHEQLFGRLPRFITRRSIQRLKLIQAPSCS